jgi:DNA-binding beta-propeller fold protein YncE
VPLIRAAVTSLWALGALLAACGDAPPATPLLSASSSTLILDEPAARLWLTSPDDDAVVAHDLISLDEVARYAVPGAPEQLARAGDLLVVTRAQSSSVALVALSDGAVIDVPTPCGGTAGVVVAEGLAYVSCPSDARVLVIGLSERAVTQALAVPGAPTGLAISGDGLAVAQARRGEVLVVSRAGLAAAGPIVALEAVRLDSAAYHAAQGIAASQLAAVASAGAGFAAVYQQVDHDSDRTRPAEQGGYGAVIDARPRIAPRVVADGCASAYARFDGSARVASGPSALAYAPASGTLWIAHLSTDNVVVLDCPAVAEGPTAPRASTMGDASEARVRAVFAAGRGPRGLAVGADGRTAWVDLGFAHAVARVGLDEAGGAATARRRMVGPTHLSPRAEAGRALFFDATNTHLTPSGVVTCGTCHPGGGDDGLSWFLHTRRVPRKLRRTPPAWSAKATLAPYHWDGELADASDPVARAAIVGADGGRRRWWWTPAAIAAIPWTRCRSAAAAADPRGGAVGARPAAPCSSREAVGVRDVSPGAARSPTVSRHDVVPLGERSGRGRRAEPRSTRPSLSRRARAAAVPGHDGRAEDARASVRDDPRTEATAPRPHVRALATPSVDAAASTTWSPCDRDPDRGSPLAHGLAA